MSQPTPYTRQTDFSEDERANVGGRSTVRTDKLDAELDALGATANAAAQNLGLIQRDDGALRDRVVTPESLSPSTALMIGSTGFRPRGVYALGQSYQIRDMVEVDSGVYVCIQAVPTATNFNTERAAGKWQAFSTAPSNALTALGLPFGPVAGISATNAQAAIVETHDLAAQAKTTADQAKTTADQALAGAGSGSGSGSGSTAIPPFAVAALAAAASAANRVNAEVRDPTLPPKAPTPTLLAGVGQIEVSWPKATYTVGHGPGRVLLWAAEWVNDTTAPAFSAAKALGAQQEVAERVAIGWNPNKKVRVWIAFESFDAYQGPVSDPADVTTIPIPATALGQLQFDANSLAAGLETGALVNDPHFSGGATRWANFLVRHGGGTSGVPAGCPVEYAAQFKGRDCVDTRGYSVRAGDQLVLSIFAHNGTTGLQVGIVAYFEYADGRAITPASVTKTPPPNTWTRIDGPITVPSGAVRMRIGPHISQAHTGTQTCWFGYIRAIKVSEGDEIRQGSITAASLAAGAVTSASLSTDALTAIKANIGSLKTNAADITGQLTAEQIDARGLAIKDANGNVILGAGTALGAAYLQVGVANRFTLEENFSVSTGNFLHASGESGFFTSRPVSIGVRGWLSISAFAQLTSSVAGGLTAYGPEGNPITPGAPASCVLLVTATVTEPVTGLGATVENSPHKLAMSRQGSACIASIPIQAVIPMMFTNRPNSNSLVVKIKVSAQIFNAAGVPYVSVNNNASSATVSGRLFWVENPI